MSLRPQRLLPAALALAMLACGGQSAETKPAQPTGPKPGSDETAGSVQVEEDGSGAIERIDVNGDNKADVFKFYRVGADQKKVLIRKELDVNFDQRIDIVQYYAGEAGKETLVREELDLDFDGRVDQTRHYKDGYKHLVELDLGFDGRTDTWRYYQKTQTEDGRSVVRLVEKRRDTDGNGAVDVWEYYVGGKLQKIAYDTTGDGAPDRFTNVGKKK